MFQLNNVEKAIAAAHTFLKKNPTDPYLTKNMNYYKTLFDVEEHLIDHEEQPYEVCGTPLSTSGFTSTQVIHNLLLSRCTECVPEECDALQQRRF